MRSLKNEDIDHIGDLLSLQENDIDNLKFLEDDGTTLSVLKAGHRGRLRCFCAFVRYRSAQSMPIGDTWTSITQEEFDEYLVSPAYDGTIFGTSSSVSNHDLPAAPGSTRPRDPVADFKKGIKRDPSQFPILKEDKQWDNWNRTTNAQGRAQDIAEVLDPTYKPITAEVRLYEAQVAIDEHFSSGQKKNMLQNAVRRVPQLCSVKTQADHLKTHDGKDLTNDSYVKLLLSAASTYDSQFAPKTLSGSRPPRRDVYSHDVPDTYYGDSDAFYDSAVVYAIDCGLHAIQAHAHASDTARPPGAHASDTARPPGTTRPPGTSMPFSKVSISGG
jgi:hypothetical protein